MKHYLFCEEVSGEEFIVGANDKEEAFDIAIPIAEDIAENWNEGVYELIFYSELTEEEAEASGLDEY